MNEPSAEYLTFDDDKMWVHLRGGLVLEVPLSAFARLMQAQPLQRAAYLISGNGSGLHWEALDEDLSVQHLLREYGRQGSP
ncbi:DUF2442 domain-containing protein [Pseudoduganella sp. LjRoot289]|uniref:DUF2442 domain-containing protein n=1 Tax=Pseudoduganella sp. LjRoot289 TaxID=3342314 RepID=UPI003ECD0E8A